MAKTINNYAFISYSHKDAKIARWLQQKLEKFLIPYSVYEQVHEENLPPNKGRYIRPVFLDETDLTTGVLADTLRENLVNSRYLIVICSPNSAKSEWVSKEVQYFIETGRLEHIIPFVIDGTPYLDMQIAAGKNPIGEECMPQYLVEFTKEHPELELLGIDLRDNGLEKSAMRIISRMLDVGFDLLWNRQARRRRVRFISFLLAMVVAIAFSLYFFLPINLSYTIYYPDDENTLLMPEDALLTIEGVSYFLGSNLDTTIELKSRPGYYRGRVLPVEFHATYFESQNANFKLGYGFKKNNNILYIKRDNTFGLFAGRIIDVDGEPIEGARVAIRQYDTKTNEDGRFELLLPLGDQAEEQRVYITRAGFSPVYRPDECPSDNLVYIMHRLDE